MKHTPHAMHMLADLALSAAPGDDHLTVLDGIAKIAVMVALALPPGDDLVEVAKIASEASAAAEAIRRADRLQLEFRAFVARGGGGEKGPQP